MSIATAIAALQNASSDIADAIAAKGVTVPSGSGFDDYASLIGQISGGGGPTSYVENGLVLWLDGINKGATSGAWTSLVGNHVFSGTATFDTDNVYFNGTSNFLSNSSFTPPSPDVGTIEVVFDAADSGRNRILFMPKGTSGAIAFGLLSTDGAIWNITPKKALYTNCTEGSVSISAARGLLNGNAMSTGAEENWGSPDASYSYVGKRNRSGGECYFKGKIYCIRIYNRQLTVAESLSNYAVDKNRFNI